MSGWKVCVLKKSRAFSPNQTREELQLFGAKKRNSGATEEEENQEVLKPFQV